MDVQDVENAAKELVEARMESVRELARRRAAVAQAQEQLADAQASDHEAYKTAVKAGWSADELKKVGLAPLDAPAARRRKRKKTTTPTEGRETVASSEHHREPSA